MSTEKVNSIKEKAKYTLAIGMALNSLNTQKPNTDEQTIPYLVNGQACKYEAYNFGKITSIWAFSTKLGINVLAEYALGSSKDNSDQDMLLKKGNTIYLWNTSSNEGIKLKVSQDYNAYYFAGNSDNIQCHDISVFSRDFFNPPKNINFKKADMIESLYYLLKREQNKK